MHFSNWLLFCGVTLLVAFTPGPAVLLAVSNSMSVGPRRAMISSLGNAMGLFMVSAAEIWGYHDGTEWLVSQYLLAPRA